MALFIYLRTKYFLTIQSTFFFPIVWYQSPAQLILKAEIFKTLPKGFK